MFMQGGLALQTSEKIRNANPMDTYQSEIMLRLSSQCETSVVRVRVMVIKYPLQIRTSPLQICTSRTTMH